MSPHRTLRRSVVSLLLAGCTTAGCVALATAGAASGATGQSSLPTTAMRWDPQTTNVPYLAWAGEQVRVEKCFTDPYMENGSKADLSSIQADLLVEDWSGDTAHQPQVEFSTARIFWSSSLNQFCAEASIISLYPGMARAELDIVDPNGVLGYPTSSPNEAVIKHQFLVGWMTLNQPTLTRLAASSFASTAQAEAAKEMGDPQGSGQLNAGSKTGYLDVKVTGSMPMNGAWGTLIGQPTVTLPNDWALLANKLATDDIASNSQAAAAQKWDIMNDPVAVEGHVLQTPVPCSPLPAQFASAPAAPTGTDNVDDCTGGGADGPFSTQFGILSSSTAIGPFDPTRASDTLLPNGILDWADAPMPAARIDVSIAPNSGGSTDTTGVGSLAAANKTKTYSRDFLGDTNSLPHNEYAPFYDQYIPATAAPGDASSGVDGGTANNFNGFLVNGTYHNWDIASTLASAPGGATSCLESSRSPQTATPANNPRDFYQMPSGAQSVAVYTDNHGEAQVQYVPGTGFYFDSLINNGSAITNANGGCDLQSLYGVAGGLGSATITATARYPFKPVDYPDLASAPVTESVSSLWSKTLSVYPKGTGTANNNARIVTSHAQNIDGSPFAHEVVCFMADSNAENLSMFRGTVGGYSYGGVNDASWYDRIAGKGATCVLSDSNGNAAVEVFNSNGTTVNVIADFENEGILRDIMVGFGSTSTSTSTSTNTPSASQSKSTLPGSSTSTQTSAPSDPSSSTSSTGGQVKRLSTPASKKITAKLTFTRLMTPTRGAHRLLVHVASHKARVRLRLRIVERLVRKDKHGRRHVVRRTVVRRVTVRTGRNVSIKLPNTAVRVLSVTII